MPPLTSHGIWRALAMSNRLAMYLCQFMTVSLKGWERLS